MFREDADEVAAEVVDMTKIIGDPCAIGVVVNSEEPFLFDPSVYFPFLIL